MMKKSNKVILGILYWTVQLTWGLLTTIVGLIATVICVVFLKGKIHKNGFSYIIEVGGNWGGVNMGAVSFCGNYYGTSYWDEVRCHEFGHSIQNLFLGPLFPFIVGIPSTTRYWLSMFGKLKQDYDYAWFEYTASKWGTAWINKLEDKDFVYSYQRVKK